MDSDQDSTNYFSNSSSSNHAKIIEIFDDSEKDNSVHPKVELPNFPLRNQSPRTSELINQIQTLNQQLSVIRARTQS